MVLIIFLEKIVYIKVSNLEKLEIKIVFLKTIKFFNEINK